MGGMRYKQNFFLKGKTVPCVWCNQELTEEEATLEHLVPASWGGKRTDDNIRIACKKCNNERGQVTAMYDTARSAAKMTRKYPERIRYWNVYFRRLFQIKTLIDKWDRLHQDIGLELQPPKGFPKLPRVL